MKTLWILRHAKSSWKDGSLADFDRPLNGRGRRNALDMARRLAARHAVLDRVVSSPALRARQTVEIFAGELAIPPESIDWTPSLYEAGTETWWQTVAQLDPGWNSVLMAGHNPAITQLVRQLGLSSLQNVPTCGLAECRAPSWNAFPEGSVASFDHPRKTAP